MHIFHKWVYEEPEEREQNFPGGAVTTILVQRKRCTICGKVEVSFPQELGNKK